MPADATSLDAASWRARFQQHRSHGLALSVRYIDEGVAVGAIAAAEGALGRASRLIRPAHPEQDWPLLDAIDEATAVGWAAESRDELSLLRARRAEAGGDLAQALALAEQGITAAPEQMQLAVYRQELLYKLKRLTLDELARSFEAIVDQHPRHLVPMGALAELSIMRADHERAEALARRVLAIAPDDVYGLHLLGKIRFMQNRNDEAVEYLERASAADPENPDRLLLLMLLYDARNEAGRLLQVGRFAIERHPDNAVFRFKHAHALLLFTPRESADALAHARRACELEARNGEARVVLAFCLANVGRWAEAAPLVRQIRAEGVPVTTFDLDALEQQIRSRVSGC